MKRAESVVAEVARADLVRMRSGSAMMPTALKTKADQGMSQMKQRPQKSQRGAVS